MSATDVTERARSEDRPDTSSRTLDRVLGHPAAFVVTALVLLALFGGTFIANPDRVAPTKDPAYYTWRTEALLTETPQTVLDVKGPFDFFSSGYRVTAPVTGGLLRRIPGVSELHTTVFLMVLIPVFTALLLAGFAYRQRRDPLLWHAVALITGSLYLTPPFVGYLDNVLCLFFLAASLSFITETKDSWPARAGFGLFLLLAGLTHPTTLAFFGFTLGVMTAARLLWRRFDVRSVVRDDGPMLGTAVVAAIGTFLIWKIGIWGTGAPLADAALAPPYSSDFFVARLKGWVDAMRPLFNGPLLAIGIAGLFVAGRRARADARAGAPGGTWVEDDLARVAILWLAPLAGIFGFVGGLTYPYYRFFNTTLAWVMLVGMGGYFLVRFVMERNAIAGYVVLALLAFIAATNFTSGFELAGWNNTTGGWVSGEARTDLDALRARLDALDQPDRPVIFVIDQDDHSPQIYGYTKLSGNTSRYGLPDGMIERGFIYLGSAGRLLSDQPTSVGEKTYDDLSAETLADIQDNAGAAEPLIVVAAIFNHTGANASLVGGGPGPVTFDLGDAEVWSVAGGAVVALNGDTPPEAAPGEGSSSPLHLVQVLVGFVLLLIPGALALRYFLPGAGLAEGLGMAPALSAALLSLVGVFVVAVTRSPFSSALALATLVLAAAVGAVLFVRGRGRAPAPARIG